VQVDHFGTPDAFALNAELEFSRNRERYAFLRWGQQAFANSRRISCAAGASMAPMAPNRRPAWTAIAMAR
jgi:aconitase A